MSSVGFYEGVSAGSTILNDIIVRPILALSMLAGFVYGALAYVKDYFRVKSAGSLEKAKNQRTGNFGRFFKNILSTSKYKE